jgi:antitoxin StbD
MDQILCTNSVSVSELKRNPTAVIDAAAGEPLAVLVHNKASAYLIPAETYRTMLKRLEDAELGAIVRQRRKERTVKVTLDEL